MIISINDECMDAALTAAVDRCIDINAVHDRNMAIRRACVEEGYRLAQSQLAVLAQRDEDQLNESRNHHERHDSCLLEFISEE